MGPAHGDGSEGPCFWVAWWAAQGCGDRGGHPSSRLAASLQQELPQLSWVPLSWAVSLWGICFLICLLLGTSRGSGDCGQGLPHLTIW